MRPEGNRESYVTWPDSLWMAGADQVDMTGGRKGRNLWVFSRARVKMNRKVSPKVSIAYRTGLKRQYVIEQMEWCPEATSSGIQNLWQLGRQLHVGGNSER